MGLRGGSNFSNCKGGGCNRGPVACNKLRGSVDMFLKEIFGFLTICGHFGSFQTFKVHFSSKTLAIYSSVA